MCVACLPCPRLPLTHACLSATHFSATLTASEYAGSVLHAQLSLRSAPTAVSLLSFSLTACVLAVLASLLRTLGAHDRQTTANGKHDNMKVTHARKCNTKHAIKNVGLDHPDECGERRRAFKDAILDAAKSVRAALPRQRYLQALEMLVQCVDTSDLNSKQARRIALRRLQKVMCAHLGVPSLEQELQQALVL